MDILIHDLFARLQKEEVWLKWHLHDLLERLSISKDVYLQDSFLNGCRLPRMTQVLDHPLNVQKIHRRRIPKITSIEPNSIQRAQASSPVIHCRLKNVSTARKRREKARDFCLPIFSIQWFSRNYPKIDQGFLVLKLVLIVLFEQFLVALE
jgi:hypothetical protein